MSTIIAVSNQKGGVGKTTTAISLSGAFLHFQKTVLLVDMDPQGNCSRGVGIDGTLLNHTITDVFLRKYDVRKVIRKTAFKGLHVLPSTVHLALVDTKLHSENPFVFLRNILQEVEKEYDYILIDCPPSFGFLTLNSLVAADKVLIPVQCEYFALEAVAQVLSTISKVQSEYNERLEILGFLMTMYDSRTRLATEITTEIRGLFKEKTFVTQIPRNISIVEAQMKGQPVTVFRPTASGSTAYIALAREILQNEERKEKCFI